MDIVLHFDFHQQELPVPAEPDFGGMVFRAVPAFERIEKSAFRQLIFRFDRRGIFSRFDLQRGNFFHDGEIPSAVGCDLHFELLPFQRIEIQFRIGEGDEPFFMRRELEGSRSTAVRIAFQPGAEFAADRFRGQVFHGKVQLQFIIPESRPDHGDRHCVSDLAQDASGEPGIAVFQIFQGNRQGTFRGIFRNFDFEPERRGFSGRQFHGFFLNRETAVFVRSQNQDPVQSAFRSVQSARNFNGVARHSLQIILVKNKDFDRIATPQFRIDVDHVAGIFGQGEFQQTVPGNRFAGVAHHVADQEFLASDRDFHFPRLSAEIPQRQRGEAVLPLIGVSPDGAAQIFDRAGRGMAVEQQRGAAEHRQQRLGSDLDRIPLPFRIQIVHVARFAVVIVMRIEFHVAFESFAEHDQTAAQQVSGLFDFAVLAQCGFSLFHGINLQVASGIFPDHRFEFPDHPHQIVRFRRTGKIRMDRDRIHILEQPALEQFLMPGQIQSGGAGTDELDPGRIPVDALVNHLVDIHQVLRGAAESPGIMRFPGILDHAVRLLQMLFIIFSIFGEIIRNQPGSFRRETDHGLSGQLHSRNMFEILIGHPLVYAAVVVAGVDMIMFPVVVIRGVVQFPGFGVFEVFRRMAAAFQFCFFPAALPVRPRNADIFTPAQSDFLFPRPKRGTHISEEGLVHRIQFVFLFSRNDRIGQESCIAGHQFRQRGSVLQFRPDPVKTELPARSVDHAAPFAFLIRLDRDIFFLSAFFQFIDNIQFQDGFFTGFQSADPKGQFHLFADGKHTVHRTAGIAGQLRFRRR